MRIQVKMCGADALDGLGDAMREACLTGVREAAGLLGTSARELAPADADRLAGSIAVRAEPAAGGAAGIVSAQAEKAAYLELGTGGGMRARPFLYPAYRASRARMMSAIASALKEGMTR